MGRPRVKRGYAIYPKTKSPWKIVIACLIVLVAVGLTVFLIASVYAPMVDYLQSDASSSSAESSSVVSRAPAVQAPDSSSQSAAQALFHETQPAKMRAAFMPVEEMTDQNRAYTFLNDLVQKGYTTVVMECKDADGWICYQSKDTFVVQKSLMRKEGTGDLSALVTAAHELGLTVYASVYGFEDHQASKTDISLAIRYQDRNDTYWLDAALEEGGQTWLNPYSDDARDYVCRVIDEVTLYGADGVVLDARFPDVDGSEYAGYGADAETLSKADLLATFVNRCRLAAAANDAVLLYQVSAAAALDLDAAAYGDANPLRFGEEYALVDLRLERFEEIVSDDETVSDPAADPAAALTLLSKKLDEQNQTGIVLTAMYQRYLSREDLRLDAFLPAQDAAAAQIGLGAYFYEPNGLYSDALASSLTESASADEE